MLALVIILSWLLIMITIVLVAVLRGCQKDIDNQELFIQDCLKITGLLSRMFEIDRDHDHGHSDEEWLKCYNELTDMWRKEQDKL